MKFSVNNEENKTLISVKNPTPWYMNLNNIMVAGEKAPNMMIAPKSEETIIFDKALPNSKQINFNIINDQGNNWHYQIDL